MAGQNLGKLERLVRLVLGIGLGAWTFLQPALGLLEGLALLSASFLLLNCIFGRCYLWQLLRLNTCEQCQQRCDRQS